MNPDGTLKSGINPVTQLPYGNVPGYTPGGNLTPAAGSNGYANGALPQASTMVTGNPTGTTANGYTPVDPKLLAAVEAQRQAGAAQATADAAPQDQPAIQAAIARAAAADTPYNNANTPQNYGNPLNIPAGTTAGAASGTPAASAPPHVDVPQIAGPPGTTPAGTAPTASLTGLPAGSVAASPTPISQTPAPFNQMVDQGVGTGTTPTPIAPPNSAGTGTAVAPPVGASATGTNIPATNAAQPATTSTPNDVLSQLLTGVSGQGAGSAVSNATQQAELAQLANPNPYQSAAVQAQETAGQDTLNQQFGAEQKQLDEYLASRGIAASSFGGGYQGDLAGQQATAEAGLQSNILTNEAASQLAGTGQAISQGQSGAASATNTAQSWLNQLMGYGQQAFNNDTTTNAANTQQNQNYQNFLLQMLGMGYSGGTTTAGG